MHVSPDVKGYCPASSAWRSSRLTTKRVRSTSLAATLPRVSYAGALGEYKSALSAGEAAVTMLARGSEPLLLARAKQGVGSALGAFDRGTDGEVLPLDSLRSR